MIKYILFTLMIVSSSGLLLWFLFRPMKNNLFNLENSNIALGRQKQRELQSDLRLDLIDKSVFDQAQDEITQTLAIELTQSSGVVVDGTGSRMWVGIVSVIFISILSVGLYKSLSPETTKPVTVLATSEPTISLADSIVKIENHLLENPNDDVAWGHLGLLNFELSNLGDSLIAYEKSYQLNQNDPVLLVNFASAIATQNDGVLIGKPIELVRMALKIDPNLSDALYLSGLFAMSVQKFGLAMDLWERADSNLPVDSPYKSILIDSMSELGFLMDGVESKPSHSVVVDVSISDGILESRSKDGYVMVYIKASKGRPMPIAIQKIKLGKFTGVVELTDGDSVMPTRKLSEAGEVVVVVRLSNSGSAMKQADDVQVLSRVIDVKSNPTVVVELK